MKRLYRAGVEIVVAVFAVIEMKPAKLSKLNEPRDYLFDIDVWRVMSEIDEAIRFFSKL